MLEVAKVTSKGQITIPKAIRERLGLSTGAQVAFIEKDGIVQVVNTSMVALQRVQDAFAGEAKRLGLKDEDDVTALVKETRGY